MTRANMRFHGIILHTQTLHNRLESDLVVSKMLFKNGVCVCVCWGYCIISYTVPSYRNKSFFFFQGKSLCERSVSNITSLKTWRFGQEPGVCNSFAQGRDFPLRSQAPCYPPPHGNTRTHTHIHEKQDKCWVCYHTQRLF